jgi:hypothetical protein
MSNIGCFFVDPKCFHWFHLGSETREKDLATGVLTIRGWFCDRHWVVVEIKNGIAKVSADNGILPRLEQILK